MNKYTANIDTDRLDEYYVIDCMEERFSRTDSGKSWRKRCDSWHIDSDIPARYYFNAVDAVPFFRALGGRETVYKSYCVAGYLPAVIISVSPDGQQKIVRSYRFSLKQA